MATNHAGNGGLAGGSDQLLINVLQSQAADHAFFISAVGETAQNDAGSIVELTGVAQVSQHAVHLIGTLADLFDKQNLALGIDLVRRAKRGSQQRQVAAAQTALGLTGHDGSDGAAFGIDIFHGLTEQHSLYKGSAVLVQTIAPSTHHGHMVRFHATDLVEGVEHSGHVAVTAEDLGILLDGLPVQQRQDTVEAVAAAGTDDALDTFVGKSSVNVGSTDSVHTGQKAVAGGGTGIEHRLQTHVTDSLHQLLGGFRRGAGTTQNSQTIAGLQGFGTDHLRFLQSDIQKREPRGAPFWGKVLTCWR